MKSLLVLFCCVTLFIFQQITIMINVFKGFDDETGALVCLATHYSLKYIFKDRI